MAALAIVSTMVVMVGGTFSGLEDQTESRVAAFFTGTLRVTADKPAVAPDVYFDNQTLPGLRDEGGTWAGRIETTYVLSRRTLLESVLEEDEQYRVGQPGVDSGGEEFYGIGVLLGLANDDPGRSAIRQHMVVGAWPVTSSIDPDVVPLLLSVDRFAATLSDDEKATFSTWPPSASELGSTTYEITAARVDHDSRFKDVIRRPAVVVGLFETGLDVLDDFTIVTSLDQAQILLGGGDRINVITAHHDADAARQQAHGRGLATEGATAFTGRYVGQLVAVVEMLSLLVTILFFALPVFLMWHGLAQALDRHEREVAVCRAIGVPWSAIQGAIMRLTAAVCVRALLIGAIASVVIGAWLGAALPQWDGSPVPLGFTPPWGLIAATVVLVIATAAFAVWSTMRRHARVDLASRLRV